MGDALCGVARPLSPECAARRDWVLRLQDARLVRAKCSLGSTLMMNDCRSIEGELVLTLVEQKHIIQSLSWDTQGRQLTVAIFMFMQASAS